MSKGIQIQVIARSEAARFNTNRFVTVRIRRRRTTTMQTKVLPMTLMIKIMAYNDSLTALNAAGVSPISASDVFPAPSVLNTELLFTADEFIFLLFWPVAIITCYMPVSVDVNGQFYT